MSRTKRAKRRRSRRSGADRSRRSLQAARADTQSLRVLEDNDKFSGARNFLRALSAEADQWAGIPMPLDGERLVITPSFPNAELYMSLGAGRQDSSVPEGVTLRNCPTGSRDSSHSAPRPTA